MKCQYCGKEITKKDYCSSQCQNKAKEFNQFKRKYMPIFAIIALIAMILALTWNHPFRTPLCLLLLGGDFLLFPFTKVSIVNRKGIQHSIKVARRIGAIALITGCIAFILVLV